MDIKDLTLLLIIININNYYFHILGIPLSGTRAPALCSTFAPDEGKWSFLSEEQVEYLKLCAADQCSVFIPNMSNPASLSCITVTFFCCYCPFSLLDIDI